MTATVLLVRHASHDRLGKVLCGRMAGVTLSEAGRGQAAALAQGLAALPTAAVYASPMERAWETAEPIAQATGAPLAVEDSVQEIDFGDWTGARFEALDGQPAWRTWNEARSVARPPNGESMGEAQARALAGLKRLAARRPQARFVVVSHADVIKACICGMLGLSLDHYDRFDIDPASVTTCLVGDWGMKVSSMNETPAWR